MSNLFF